MMSVFEFHFNPKKEESVIFDSFCFEPENVQEQGMGNLYIVAQLSNALPNDSHILNDLAQKIKEKYFTESQLSPEQGLRQGLKAANDFLANQIKNEKNNWLGNLNFAVFSCKDFTLNFTKTGNIKVLLNREKEITDIGQSLESQAEKSEPTQIFGNIVTGKLAQDDKVIVLTKDLFEFFSQDNLIKDLAYASKEKEFRQIFKAKKQALLEISGICFVICFAMREKIPGIALPMIKLPKIAFPAIKIPGVEFFSQMRAFKNSLLQKLFSPSVKKGFVLIALFVFVLSIGFLVFQKEKQAELESAQQIIEEVEANVIQAENFLILQDEKKANLLFQEAWATVLAQTKIRAPLRNEAQTLKKSIEQKLFSLNKLENIEEPELFFEFQAKEFYAQGLIFKDSTLYSFYSKENGLYDIPSLGIVAVKGLGMDYDGIASFAQNIYLLDSKQGEILKEYSPWLSAKTEKKPNNGVSLAVDGSIWVLNQDGSIDKYYAGIWQKTLILEFFPKIEKGTKIYTNPQLPALYILEPIKNRLIVIDKTGQIIKQYQSDKFDNLRDFIISENGKEIYLLNNLKIFQILFSS